MPEQRENYKGREIIVETGDNQTKVQIDGNEIEVAKTNLPGDM